MRRGRRTLRRQSTSVAQRGGPGGGHGGRSPDSSSCSSRDPSPCNRGGGPPPTNENYRPAIRRQSTTEEILIARGFRRQSTTEEMIRYTLLKVALGKNKLLMGIVVVGVAISVVRVRKATTVKDTGGDVIRAPRSWTAQLLRWPWKLPVRFLIQVHKQVKRQHIILSTTYYYTLLWKPQLMFVTHPLEFCYALCIYMYIYCLC